jgi:type I restriction enzyme S subunit
MKVKEQNVPELRFPEFEGEWTTDRLSKSNLKVIDGDRGVNYPQKSDFSKSGYCLFLNAKNVTKSGFLFGELSFISKEKDSAMSKGKLKREDLLLTTRGSVGHIALYDSNVKYENIRINSGMVILRNIGRGTLPSFLYFSFNSPTVTSQIKRVAFGSAQPQLTVKEINRFWLKIPKLDEQKKIAAFLTAVDSKIEQLSKKKALLEQYKKGMMQKLFSQELRFKDDQGNEFPEKWGKRYLGECVDLISGQHLSPNEYSKESGECPYFTGPSDFTNNPKGLKKWATVTSKNAHIGDVLITVKGSGVGELWYLRLPKVAMGRQLMAIRGRTLKSDLIFHFLSTKRNYLTALAAGNMIPGLSRTDLLKIKVRFPVDPNEQQKIADFLSSIDKKITLISTELNHAQAFKKALLQQMFI